MRKSMKTNPIDWSQLIPILPDAGPRRIALYRALRGLIERRLLAPGTKLPTTRDLAARLAIARGAAVAAYDMLVADGFAEARVGDGTYVGAAVPFRRDGEAVMPAPAAREEKSILPGELGVAVQDRRTMALFRTFLMRELANPRSMHFMYGDGKGSRALRMEIAAYLRIARGVRCDAEQILLTAGIQQGLDLAIRAVVAPGDTVLVEDPCYAMARAAFEQAKAELIGVAVDAEGMAIDAVADNVSAKLIYVTPSNQFPLGVTMSMRRRLALIARAKSMNAFIVEDDYDSEFRFSGAPLSSLQGIDDAGRVIYLGTFSKALFPGLRVGYAVLPDALVDPILTIRNRIDRFPSTLAQAPLVEFLRQGEFAAHLRRARKKVRAARDALHAEICSGPLDATLPEQGLHLVAQPLAELEERHLLDAAAKAGLGARALSPMYLSEPPRRGVVIGFSGFTPDAFGEAARRWVRHLQGMAGP